MRLCGVTDSGECVRVMNYSLIAGLVAAFLISVFCAIEAKWIRDYILNSTVKYSGVDSLSYRLQRWFIGNDLYVMSVRIASSLIAICILAMIIYVVTSARR